MYNSIIISAAIAFLTTILVTPKLMRFLKFIGVEGIDQNKKNKPTLPTSHGTAIAMGLFIGLFSYIGISTFITEVQINITLILAAFITIETITVIGFIDDIYMNKTIRKDSSGEMEYRRGLKKWQKTLMILPAAIPLMAVNAGHSILTFPIIGAVDFGIFYALILVPIGVVCVASAYNMLGGLNGLEASMGAVALTGLGIFAVTIGKIEAAAIAFVAAAAILAILKYAWTPTKFLPGDSTTYLIGSAIAAVVLIGNMEKFGFIIFLPWAAEAVIKAKQKFKATCMGKLMPGGYLKPKNGRIESLTHVVMSLGKFREQAIVSIFVIIEAIFVLLAFALYYAGII